MALAEPGQANLVTMAQYLVERRLMDVSKRLRKAREELAVADEQFNALAEVADEARIRSLVSETPSLPARATKPSATQRRWAGAATALLPK